MTEAAVHTWEGPTKDVALKIWRVDENGERELKTYEVEAPERERIVSQKEMNVIAKESLCIMCGCCVSECNAMEADPDFRGPAALAKEMRFVGDTRDHDDVPRLNTVNDEHGVWDCTRCYF